MKDFIFELIKILITIVSSAISGALGNLLYDKMKNRPTGGNSKGGKSK
ncbi:hypothetical protein [Peptacetobacter hiranonis]